MRVLMVDKLRLFGDMLKIVLQKEPDMMVIGCATTPEHALHQVGLADIVLVNTTHADEEAIDLVRRISDEHPDVKTLVAGISEDPEVIISFVEAGASGYIAKQDSVERLIDKIRAAEKDQAFISPDVAANLMSRLATLNSLRPELWAAPEAELRRFEDLTPREREVLGLLGEGLTNQEIADRLYIEHGTVKNHVHRILKKLNATNRHEAAAAYMMRLKHDGRARVHAA